jgi:hypothetical protein
MRELRQLRDENRKTVLHPMLDQRVCWLKNGWSSVAGSS